MSKMLKKCENYDEWRNEVDTLLDTLIPDSFTKNLVDAVDYLVDISPLEDKQASIDLISFLYALNVKTKINTATYEKLLKVAGSKK